MPLAVFMIRELPEVKLEEIVANSRYEADRGVTDGSAYFLRLKKGKKAMLVHISHTPDGYRLSYRSPLVKESHIFGQPPWLASNANDDDVYANAFWKVALSELLSKKTTRKKQSFERFQDHVINLYDETSKNVKRLKVFIYGSFVAFNIFALYGEKVVWDMDRFDDYTIPGLLIFLVVQACLTATGIRYYLNKELKELTSDTIEYTIRRNPVLGPFYDKVR